MEYLNRGSTLEPRDTALTTNVRAARIARVYAEALLGVAARDGQAEDVGDELDALVTQVLANHPRVAAFFESLAVSRRAREPVLNAALGENASPLVRNFVGVLNQNNRLDLLRAVAAAYRELLDKRSGRVRVRVRSAAPLTDDQQRELRESLAASLGREPVLDLRTDPELLGGMVVQVGDKVYDSSVRTRLAAFRTQLLARSTHGSQA